MANENPKRYEWLLSFPKDDMQDNASENSQNNTNQVDSAQLAQDASVGTESGEGALSSSVELGEGACGDVSGGVQMSCDGGCAM